MKMNKTYSDHQLEVVKSLLYDKCDNFVDLTKLVNLTLDSKIVPTDSCTTDMVDKDFLEEVKLIHGGITNIFFGKALNDMLCIVRDTISLRDHKVYFSYKAPKRLFITSMNIPHFKLQDQEFSSLQEIVKVVQRQLDSLSKYFKELEEIDQNCFIMEPVNASFRDDYRRIFIDDRTWLHVEVTPDGSSTNVHLVGQSETWQEKLNAGLLTWDHDKSIVENILLIFDLSSFPMPNSKLHCEDIMDEPRSEVLTCGICLCHELPDRSGIPQPLCPNKSCGVHYHKDCLFEWLIACAGGRPPTFGVATGSCPTCLQPITCSEKDS